MTKVEMVVVRKNDRITRAMKPFLIDERWADRIQKVSKGRIRRVSAEEETPRRRRRRRDEE